MTTITPLTIVTGADATHFRSLCQFLESVGRFESQAALIVYDLGLLPEQSTVVRELFTGLEMVRFDYEHYPDYFDIKRQRGAYAWKPALIYEVFERIEGDLVWFDAGCLLTGTLAPIRHALADAGVYSPLSSGTVSDWTHPLTLNYLQVEGKVLPKRNFNGACVAVSRAFENRHGLLRRWRECALDKACIAPTGSDRSNHRQDQAVLTVLLYKLDLPGVAPGKHLNFKTHQDIDGRRKSTDPRRELVLKVRSGLANRLRVYLSARYLATQFGRDLRLVWRPDASCGALWQDLFVNPVEELSELPEDSQVLDGADSKSLQRCIAAAKRVVCVEDMRFLTPHRLRRHIVDKLDTLEPTDEIAARVELLTCQFEGQVMGVHIRRRNFSSFLSRKGAALPHLEAYFQHMDQWQGGFFIATDAGPEIENVFRDRYGRRIITQRKQEKGRDTPGSVKEALIDLLTLRQCKFLVRTKHSSFSTMARGPNAQCVAVFTPLSWFDMPAALHLQINDHYRWCLRRLEST